MSPQRGCPADSDEVAEAFVRKTLSRNRATFFKTHIASCSECAKEVENTRAFVLAMLGALGGLEAKQYQEANMIRFVSPGKG
jgi:hypothetical protein